MYYVVDLFDHQTVVIVNLEGWRLYKPIVLINAHEKALNITMHIPHFKNIILHIYEKYETFASIHNHLFCGCLQEEDTDIVKPQKWH